MIRTRNSQKRNSGQCRRSLLNRLGLGLALGVLLVAPGTAAHAIVLTVDTTGDSLDYECFEDCSLRDAVYVSNINAGLDYIRLLEETYTLTLTGAGEDFGYQGDLDITDQVFMFGAGPEGTVIDATGLGDRVLHIRADAGMSVFIFNITVTGGEISDEAGGGIRHDSGKLVLTNVFVTDNLGMDGGGIYAQDDLTVQSGSVISGNRCPDPFSSGFDSYGGGIRFSNPYTFSEPGTIALTIDRSTIAENECAYGGGLDISGSAVTITNSTISRNTATWGGGGGLRLWYYNDAELANCTVYGNSSLGIGSAIDVRSEDRLSLHSVTISGNEGGGGFSVNSGHLVNLTLTNTIISGYCYFHESPAVTSEGGNLESPFDTCHLNSNLDLIAVVDPKLSDLGNYGGPTQTVWPLPGSPAVDNGTTAYCLPTDQRGYARSGPCDVGAVEPGLRRK